MGEIREVPERQLRPLYPLLDQPAEARLVCAAAQEAMNDQLTGLGVGGPAGTEGSGGAGRATEEG